ncbi:MAG: hypothetical protein ACRD4D_01900, partial [Candidatus Acidiferrales bacterium]
MSNGVVQHGVGHLFEFFRQMTTRARERGQQTIESYVLALSTFDALCFAMSGENASVETFTELVMQYSGRGDVYGKIAVPILFQELNLKIPRSYG